MALYDTWDDLCGAMRRGELLAGDIIYVPASTLREVPDAHRAEVLRELEARGAEVIVSESWAGGIVRRRGRRTPRDGTRQ